MCRGDFNENTQQTICNMEKKTTLNYLESAAMGLKNEFELELSENLTIAPLHCFSKALLYKRSNK